MSNKQKRVLSEYSNKSCLLFVLIIVFILIFTRVYRLQSFPVGFHPDEMYYLIEARSLAIFNEPLTTDWNPAKLESLNVMWAELPASVLSVGYRFSKNVFLGARIIPTAMGLTLPFLTGWFVFGLFKSKQLATIAFILSVLNPWLWQFSRMSFDPILSIWFYLLGLSLFLNLNGWKKIVSILPLFLGFFQYQGLKPLLLPLIVLVSVYQLLSDDSHSPANSDQETNVLTKLRLRLNKLYCKPSSSNAAVFCVCSFVVVLFVFYILVLLPRQSASERLNQTIWGDPQYHEKVAHEVNTERRLSFSNNISTVFSNKFSIQMRKLVGNYFSVFDLSKIFFHGEADYALFSAFSHGFFYYIDLPLIILGLFFLFSKRDYRPSRWLIISLIFLSPITSVVHSGNTSITFRSSFLFIILIIVASVGIKELIEEKKILLIPLIICYSICVLDFTYHYNYRYPIYSSNGVLLKERLLANYISRAKEKEIVIYHNQPQQLAAYLFLYAPNPNETLLNQVRGVREKNLPDNNEVVLGNLLIRTNCYNLQEVIRDSKHKIVVIDKTLTECKENDEINQTQPYLDDGSEEHLESLIPLSIASPIDSGEQYWIISDSVCKGANHNSFLEIRDWQQLSIEDMSDQDFCTTWLTDLSNIRIETFGNI